MKLRLLLICGWMSVAPAGLLWGQQQVDPPSRVARLSYLNGPVSFRSGSVEDWTAAGLNYPLTTGDHLWTDQGSRADLHVGSTIVHLNDQTAFAILNLDDRMAQISLSQGSMNVRIRRLDAEEAFEIDTPNGAISLLRPGDYRVDVNGDGSSTAVTVRAGEAEVTGGGQAFPVHARQMGRFSGTDQVAAETLAAPGPDPFDQWCMSRDTREERAMQASERYVPREMIGAEDLGEYGQWRVDPRYGAVWIPAGMPMGWAPYRNGHWAYVEPWGWTWIDDAPWGFAPFHYGRWAMMGGAWGWIPGTMVARPVYAPALVAFVGGGGFGAALAVGNVGVAAWIPLGPHEVYHPGYRVSEAYVRNVNITHVTNITSVTVTNVTYMNRDHVTAMRRTDFVGARPVAAVAVRVPPGAIGRAQTVSVMEVRPGRESYMGRPMQPGVRVFTPPARVVNQTVIVRQAPPQRERPTAPVRVAAPLRQEGARPGMSPGMNSGRPPMNTNRPPNNVYQPPVNNVPPMNNNRPPNNMNRPPVNNAPPMNNNRPPNNMNQPAVNNQPPTNNNRRPNNVYQPPVNNAPPINNNRQPNNVNQPPVNNQPPMNNNRQPNNVNQPPVNNAPPVNNNRPRNNMNQPPVNNAPPPSNINRPPVNNPGAVERAPRNNPPPARREPQNVQPQQQEKQAHRAPPPAQKKDETKKQ